MKRQTHAFASGRVMRQEVPQVRSEAIGHRAPTRGSFASEERMLDTAPTTFNQRVNPQLLQAGER
jgi:hypothetical protein